MIPSRRALLARASFRATVSITPVAGSELLTDPGLEAWTAPTNLTSWTEGVGGSSTVNQEGTAIHGGTYAGRLDVDASNSVAYIGQTLTTLAVGTWIALSGWLYASSAGKTARLDCTNSTLATGPTRNPGAAWTQYDQTARITAVNPQIRFVRDSAASASVYADDLSCKALTLSSLLAYARNPGTRQGTFYCGPTLTAGTQCGLAIGVDDWRNAAYGLFAYHDGTNGNLVKLVNGTWTSLIAAAATYAAGAQLKIVVKGTTLQLWYNGSQVGTNQTIDWAGFGTQVCGFSTYASNTCGTIVGQV